MDKNTSWSHNFVKDRVGTALEIAVKVSKNQQVRTSEEVSRKLVKGKSYKKERDKRRSERTKGAPRT